MEVNIVMVFNRSIVSWRFEGRRATNVETSLHVCISCMVNTALMAGNVDATPTIKSVMVVDILTDKCTASTEVIRLACRCLLSWSVAGRRAHSDKRISSASARSTDG